MQMRSSSDREPRRREAGNERRNEEKTQEKLKRQTGTTKWTEDERRSSRVLSEKVWRGKRKKKKKVPKIGTRSDRQKGKKKNKRGVFVSGRHFFSRGAGREIMEGLMEGWRG